MKNKRWQNIALGAAFVLPVLGAYFGKKLLQKVKERSSDSLPEVTRIRVPIASLIGLNEQTSKIDQPSKLIVIPENVMNENIETVDTMDAQANGLIASKEGGKYHVLGCRWAQNIKPENSVSFSKREQAVAHGYVPCATCQP
ncbi:MAG: Ada metal-binding domain-containing protein [Anaerolineae bacterium]|nr:Ada metal-binding domain-containing protein [Anaerolineae bacterium]